MYGCQHECAEPDQKFHILVKNNGKQPLLFSAAGYEVTRECASAQRRLRWMKEDLGGSLARIKDALRTRAFVEAFRDGAVPARQIVQQGNANYRSDIKWIVLGLNELSRFEMSSTKRSIQLFGAKMDVSATNLVGICFEFSAPVGNVKLPHTTTDDLAASSEEAGRVCVMFAPLMVMSGAQYAQNAGKTLQCDESAAHTLFLQTDAASLFLDCNNVQQQKLRPLHASLRHALLPQPHTYFLDLDTRDQKERQRVPFGLGESGAMVQDSELCVRVLLGALQRFHCESVLQRRCEDMPIELRTEALYRQTRRFEDASFRLLAQQRGFGALCRYVYNALMGNDPNVVRTKSATSLEMFRARWFCRTLGRALAFCVSREPMQYSESAAKLFLERNFGSTLLAKGLLEIREPRCEREQQAFEYCRAVGEDESTKCASLMFLADFRTWVFGGGAVRRDECAMVDGKMVLTYRSFVRDGGAGADLPWIVSFFLKLVCLDHRRSKVPRSADSYERVRRAVDGVRDDLPITDFLYSSNRSGALNDWVKHRNGGMRRALSGGKHDNYVSAAGLERGSDSAAALTGSSSDFLKDSESDQWVQLTPLQASATLRADTRYRDSKLVQRLSLRPATDMVDSLRERRALPPCLAGLEQRARGYSYANSEVGYKHYDRLDHAKLLYSLAPHVLQTDGEIVDHIVHAVEAHNNDADHFKVAKVRRDVQSARAYYDRNKAESVQYMMENRNWSEEQALERCTGCLSCDSIAKGSAQSRSAANLRCPFAAVAGGKMDRTTLAKFLDASASSAVVDIEDLAGAQRFSQTSEFVAIADYLQGKDKKARGGISAKRACVRFMRYTRLGKARQEAKKVENLVLYYPRDYTRLALHIESVSSASGKRDAASISTTTTTTTIENKRARSV